MGAMYPLQRTAPAAADAAASCEIATSRTEPVDRADDDAAGDVLTVIEPVEGWTALGLRELWSYRELIGFLVWRDVKVRYKQTALGAAWALIQPALTMVVFTLFFGRLAKVPSDGVPYPIFSFAALVPWSLFAFGLTQATNSLVGNQQLVTKVFFPRLAIPLGAVLSGLVDFALALLTLAAMLLWYHIPPTSHIVWLPLFSALCVITSLGAGIWLAALNVQYRDIRYVLPFLTQLWLFLTPIAYPSSLLREPWRTVYGLNPMSGVVEGFRWALVGTNTPPGAMTLVSTVAAVVMLCAGACYFRRMERTFADIV